jgi:hypothetical protein
MLACMPLPPLAEDVLTPMDRLDLTPAHRTLLKSTAALITQTGMSFHEFLSLEEPRIVMTIEEFGTLPDRFELWKGKVVSTEWNCPEVVGEEDEDEK